MFKDNNACSSFPEHLDNHWSSIHIDSRHHFVEEGAQRDDIKLVYMETIKQIVVILTKALGPKKFIKFRYAIVVSRSLLRLLRLRSSV